MMLRRRQFFGLAAALPAAAAAPNVMNVKSRNSGKVEVVYKTPHGKPNGLDMTKHGCWIIDQGPENWTSLINIEDGKLIREFKTDVDAASGICVDEDNVMWITSTHNSLIVSCSPADGKTIAKYWTPGAGRIYRLKGDPPGRRTTLKPAYPAPAAAAGGGQGGGGRQTSNLSYGQVPLETKDGNGGTGAHGIVAKNGLLYYANPPSRHIYVIDKKTWEVQDMWPVPGNRCHDLMWDANKETLWCADSNLNAFYRHDGKTGQILEKIQLPDDSPVIHGAKLHNGYMYFCDDVGWMCRFKMA